MPNLSNVSWLLTPCFWPVVVFIACTESPIGIGISSKSGDGHGRGASRAYLATICMVIAIGARMEWGLGCVGYGCGEGWTVAMVSKCSQLTGGCRQNLPWCAQGSLVEPENWTCCLEGRVWYGNGLRPQRCGSTRVGFGWGGVVGTEHKVRVCCTAISDDGKRHRGERSELPLSLYRRQLPTFVTYRGERSAMRGISKK